MPLKHTTDFLYHLVPNSLKAATYFLKYKGALKLSTLAKRENIILQVLQKWLKRKNDHKVYMQ